MNQIVVGRLLGGESGHCPIWLIPVVVHARTRTGIGQGDGDGLRAATAVGAAVGTEGARLPWLRWQDNATVAMATSTANRLTTIYDRTVHQCAGCTFAERNRIKHVCNEPVQGLSSFAMTNQPGAAPAATAQRSRATCQLMRL